MEQMETEGVDHQNAQEERRHRVKDEGRSGRSVVDGGVTSRRLEDAERNRDDNRQQWGLQGQPEGPRYVERDDLIDRHPLFERVAQVQVEDQEVRVLPQSREVRC